MPASGELERRVMEAGRSCSLTTAVLREWAAAGTPRQVEYLAGYLKAERASHGVNRIDEFVQRCSPRVWLVSPIEIQTQVELINEANQEIEWD